MRGRWWGIAVILAATSLAVSAKPTSKSAGSAEPVTIPLILQQAPPPKSEAKKPEPAKTEPKSPQAILEETPVAMTAPKTEPVPELPPPAAPTLNPALPTNPELFLPELKPGAELPKPTRKQPAPKLIAPKPAALPAAPPPPPPAPAPEVKPVRTGIVEMQPIDDGPPELKAKRARSTLVAVQPAAEAIVPTTVSAPVPKPKPKAPSPGEMKPVQDFSAGTLRATRDGAPPTFRCFVRDVMAFYDRTHVRCYNKVQGKVYFFAVDTSQPVAETVLVKALAAMKSGKPLTIAFAPETDLNPSNCGKKDCRRIIDIEN